MNPKTFGIMLWSFIIALALTAFFASILPQGAPIDGKELRWVQKTDSLVVCPEQPERAMYIILKYDSSSGYWIDQNHIPYKIKVYPCEIK